MIKSRHLHIKRWLSNIYESLLSFLDKLYHNKQVRVSVARSFFLKNLMNLLVYLSLPVILLSIVMSLSTQRNVSQIMISHNENLLSQVRNNFELIIDNVDSINLTFSSNAEMIGMLKSILGEGIRSSSDHTYLNIIRNFLISSVAPRQYIHSTYIYWENEDKRIITSTEGLVSYETFFDKEWLESYEKMKNDNQIMMVESRSVRRYSFEEKPTNLLTFYQRLFNENGLVVMNLSTYYLENYINNLNLAEGQVLFILDSSKNIILHSESSIIPDADDIEQMMTGASESSFSINGTPYLINRFNSEKYNWIYLTITPMASINSLAHRLQQIMILTLVLVFVICIVLATIITKHNYQKIYSILAILHESDDDLPSNLSSSKYKNEYDYIIHNILRIYVTQNRLQSQVMKDQYQMRILELSALQYQMNPHFLFNTLKDIFWMSFNLTGTQNDASRTIESLSELLYYSMNKNPGLVPISSEINQTRSYISIEQTRLRDKFDVIWEQPEDYGPYYTIRLLIQPLVENAIYHGIRAISGFGMIKIRIMEKIDKLVITVIDNGSGISENKLRQIQCKLDEITKSSQNSESGNYDIKNSRFETMRSNDTSNIGLMNCHRRIILAFGNQYGIKINSKPKLGTVIRVFIPKIENPENESYNTSTLDQ